WRTSSKVIEQSERTVVEGRETVKQGQETIKRGQELLNEKRKVDQVVAMNISKEYKDDPELAKTFDESTKRDEAKTNAEQKRLEGEIAKVDAVREKLETSPTSERGGKDLDANGVVMLKQLRQEMQDHLEA